MTAIVADSITNIQQAVLLLANEYKKADVTGQGARFPTRKASYLFANEADIGDWLKAVPEDVKQQTYSVWMKNRRPNPDRTRNSLLLKNVSTKASDADILIIAATIGTPRDIYRPKNYYTGEPSLCVFIDFETPIDMLTGLKELNGCSLYRYTICAEIPRTAFATNPSKQKKI
jgi:hypothetical protein